MTLVVAGHQVDLLPYSGFWYKMIKCDVFDLKIYDQFVDRGYQRRVKMRDQWASIPVLKSEPIDSIFNKRISPDASQLLKKLILGRYRSARYWKERGPDIISLVESITTDKLWQFNLELILGIRDFLEITTPVAIAPIGTGKGVEGLISGLRRYGRNVTYLSGTGGRAYMGDCREFDEASIRVTWSAHEAVTGDSILSVIFDYRDPIDIVLAEKESII